MEIVDATPTVATTTHEDVMMRVSPELTPSPRLMPVSLPVAEGAPVPSAPAPESTPGPASAELAALPFANADVDVPESRPVAGQKRSAPDDEGDEPDADADAEAKKARVFHTTAQGDPINAKLSEAERRAILAADPIARTVESNRVFCVECKKWVKLGDGVRFRIKHWAGHCALVHKRDRETATQLVQMGVQNAAKAAAEHAAALAAMQAKAKEEEARQRAAAAAAAAMAAMAPPPPIPRPGGVKVPPKPGVTRSVYETRATGRLTLPDPRIPPRYNYEDEIPEPYYFSDSDDSPPPQLPARFMKAADWLAANRPGLAKPAPAPKEYYLPGAARPKDPKPPRRMTPQELREEAARAAGVFVVAKLKHPPIPRPAILSTRKRKRRAYGYRDEDEGHEYDEEEYGYGYGYRDRYGMYDQRYSEARYRGMDGYPEDRPRADFEDDQDAEMIDEEMVEEQVLDDEEGDADGEEEAVDEQGGNAPVVDVPQLPPAAEDRPPEVTSAQPDVEKTNDASIAQAKTDDLQPPRDVQLAADDAASTVNPELTANNADPVADAKSTSIVAPSAADDALPTKTDDGPAQPPVEADKQPDDDHWMDLDPPPTPPGMGVSLGLPDFALGDISFSGPVAAAFDGAGAGTGSAGIGTPDVIARDVPPAPSTSASMSTTALVPASASASTSASAPATKPTIAPESTPAPASEDVPMQVEPTPASDLAPAPPATEPVVPKKPRRITAAELRAQETLPLLEPWETPYVAARIMRMKGWSPEPMRPMPAALMPPPTRPPAGSAEDQHHRDVRRAELQRDPDVRAVGVDAVQCNGCGRWFKLSADLYTASRWYGPKGHKRKCLYLGGPGEGRSTSVGRISPPPSVRAPVPAPAPVPPPPSIPATTSPVQIAMDVDQADDDLRADIHVRKVEGDRVQCNDCGKWLYKMNWPGHTSFRCRSQMQASSSTQPVPDPVPLEDKSTKPGRRESASGPTSTPTPTSSSVPYTLPGPRPIEVIDSTPVHAVPVASVTMPPPPPPAAAVAEASPPKAEDSTSSIPPPVDTSMPPPPPPTGPKRISKAAQKASNSQAALVGQRRAELARDPHVRAVNEDSVQCAACGVWVKLGETMYAGHKWDGRMGHKARCPELLKREKQAQPPKKKKPTQDDFYIPEELKNDSNIRQFDGDYVQCDHCGKWLVQENWKLHIETRCSRMKKQGRASTDGGAKASSSTKTVDQVSDESSLSEAEDDTDGPPVPSTSASKGKPALKGTLNLGRMLMSRDDPSPGSAKLPSPSTPQSGRTLLPGGRLSAKGPLPGVSEPTSTVDYQMLRKKLLETPTVRNVEGERLQCNFCGKWLLIERWEGHLEDRCRHKANTSYSRGATTAATAAAMLAASLSVGESSSSTPTTSSTQDLGALPFNKEDIPQPAPRVGRAMTQESKDAIAKEILDRTIATRIAELRADTDVKDIGEGTVLCGMCEQWVKLSNHMYAAHRWWGPNGHKAKCPHRNKSSDPVLAATLTGTSANVGWVNEFGPDSEQMQVDPPPPSG